jgi:hypothetical protein
MAGCRGRESFGSDAELKHALLTLARHEQSRECLLLLEAILETPGLMPRLMEVLRPVLSSEDAEQEKAHAHEGAKRQLGKGERW